MSRPLIVSIPHSLGKPEAVRRLKTGTDQLRTKMGEFKVTSFEDTWTDDRMTFRLSVLAQTVSGHLDVLDDLVRLEVQLPWVLSIFADRAKGFLEKQGTLMLEKK